VLKVKVMVPLLPAVRLNGLGLLTVLVRPCVTVPVLVAPGGLGFETIPFCVAVELFFTVMTSLKLVPAEIAVIGVPKVASTIWNKVIASDFSVHELEPVAVAVPANLRFVLLL